MGYLLLEHRESRGQLFFGLEEIAGVDTDDRLVGGDHRRTGRAAEAREPLAGLPVFGDVFRKMRVVGGDNQGIIVPGLHPSPTCGQAFIIVHMPAGFFG